MRQRAHNNIAGARQLADFAGREALANSFRQRIYAGLILSRMSTFDQPREYFGRMRLLHEHV